MYLLSTQMLMDIVCEYSEALSWIAPVLEDGVSVSVIAVAAVRAELAVADIPGDRRSLEASLRKFEALMRRKGGLLSFGEPEAVALAEILNVYMPVEEVDGDTELDDANRMIVATAIAKGLVLVERWQPYHDRVLPDLRAVDPYR